VGCQSIWKACASFKHKVWGWLLLHHGLVVKSRLHKVGITSSTCVVCGKEETVQHVFWKCQSARVFWSWFQAEFQSLFVALTLLEGAPLRGHLDGQGQLQITLAFSLFGCNWFFVETSL
jgi:hypothetical protein